MLDILRKLTSVLLIVVQFFSILSVSYSPPALSAENLVCGQDLNNNGYVGDEGEYKSCTGNSPGLCPIGRTSCNTVNNVSEMDPQLSCPAGFYFRNGACVTDATWAEVYITYYGFCDVNSSCMTVSNYTGGKYAFWTSPNGGRYYGEYGSGMFNPGEEYRVYRLLAPDSDSKAVDYNDSVVVRVGRKVIDGDQNNCMICESNVWAIVVQTGPAQSTDTIKTCFGEYVFNYSINKCIKQTVSYVCPLGNGNACVNDGAGYACSPNKCVDLSVNQPVDDGSIDGKTLVNDGKKDESGVCLDQVYIFSGRAQTCLPSGVSTGFQNCCANKGSTLQDSAGTLTSMGSTISTISDVYSAAKKAYDTYQFFSTAGATVAQSSAFAASAFTDAMLAAFNPATIAIAVALKLVMDYLTQACPQESIETAMFRDSGYCHAVGSYCQKRIPLIGCVQKANSYCCFNSKLARIIHEQGRPQLNTFNSWGEPTNPVCRGFTPEEFQSVDFSKIDLTEYIEDLTKTVSQTINTQINDTINDFYNKTN
ncbi:conjugal transfer protein TraN [Dickeya sp. NCPPB 3274]|uniref:conjugal transfer protein TraN n=1 Tax=Dickeya sp. NCPPB 3274 TaxID=568766 RepID=UPI0003A99EDC|nr:conjugal transfer protein TraN [Dickeya sp. NCPPB 3274]